MATSTVTQAPQILPGLFTQATLIVAMVSGWLGWLLGRQGVQGVVSTVKSDVEKVKSDIANLKASVNEKQTVTPTPVA